MRNPASKIQRGLSVLAAASALVLVSAQMSTALAASDATGVAVRYAPHDLASDATARQLLRRIEGAAHQVCGDENLEPLAIQAAARRCYLSAVAGAVHSVNAPLVRAAYVAKYGPVAPSDEAREGNAPLQRSRHG